MAVVITSNSIYTGDFQELPGMMAPMPSDATLFADFTNDTYINQAGKWSEVTNIFNFTRSGGKYIVGESGIELVPENVPAFPVNPTTGERTGILIEESITNLVEQPFNFNASNWTKSGVTASSNTDPIGLTTLTRTTSNSEHKVTMVQATALTSLANITTYQIVAKAGTNKFLQIAIPGRPTQTFANFDLEIGAVTMIGRGNTTANCIPYADGAFLCTLSCARESVDDYSVELAIINSATSLPNTSYIGLVGNIQIGMFQATAGPIEGPKSIGILPTTPGDLLATNISENWTAYMEIRMPEVLKGFNGQSVYVFSADDLSNKNFVWVGFGSSSGGFPFTAVVGQKVNDGPLRTAAVPGMGIYKPGKVLKMMVRMLNGKFSIISGNETITTITTADATGFPLSRIRPGMLLNGTDVQRGSGCTLKKLIVWDNVAFTDSRLRSDYQRLSF